MPHVSEWPSLSQDLGSFLILFNEYVFKAFNLHLFSFFCAHDVSEFLHVLFILIQVFSLSSSACYNVSTLS
jgi:hypothetical protein